MKKFITKTSIVAFLMMTGLQLMAQEIPALSQAPLPDKEAADVKSIFSDAYTNLVTSISFTGTGTNSMATPFAGDEMIHILSGLNFWTNINFSNAVNIDDMEYLHLDIFLENANASDLKIRFDAATDLVFNFSPGWNSLDIPLDDFRNLAIPTDFTQLSSLQLIRPGGYPRTIYVDNIYAYRVSSTDPVDPTEPPIDSAPLPVHDAAEVLSVFSDAYSNVSSIESFSGVGDSEILEVRPGDEMVKIVNGLNMWSSIHFTSVNIDSYTALRFDLYLDRDAGTDVRVRLNGSPNSAITKFYEPGWNVVEISLEDFRGLATPPDLTVVNQIDFIRTNGYPASIYVDNIYAHGIVEDPADPGLPTDPNAPVSAATPEHPAVDVTSFFSDVYTDVTTISVNNVGVPALTMEYVVNATDDELMSVKGLNWGMFRLDNYPWSISAEKDYLHLDVYLTSASASIRVGLGNWSQVSSSTYTLEQGWNAIDIPLDVYRDGGVNMDDLIIIKLSSGNGFAISQLYLDNIYAYAGLPTGGLPPSFEIPMANEPIMAPATVKSLFTEKYPNIVELDDLSVTGSTKFTIQALTQEDNVLKIVGLEEASVGAATAFDINDMDALHFNIYYNPAGGAGELEIGLESGAVKVYSTVVPTLNENGWSYVNVSLDEFRNAGIDCSAIDNIVFRGAGNLYVDNVFAFKGDYALGKAEEGPIVVDWATASQADVLPDRDRAFLGINLSTGAGGTTPGVYNTSYSYPTFEDLYYFKSKGVRLIRLPFKWERVQHDVDGPLDMELDVAKLTEVIAEAERIGMYVMPDMHNYCRRFVDGVKYKFGESPNLTDAHFADVWTKLAQEWKDFDNIWGYDIMNEPYGLDAGVWASAAQAAINGIRSVDTQTPIVIEGQSYASASMWLQTGAPLLDELTDPNDNLIWQAHTYFDANKSGQYGGTFDEEVSSSNMPIARIKPFVDWLKATNQRGILGEFGVPRDDVRWLHLLDEVLAYLKENQVSATYWVGGSWYEQNSLGVQPLQNYTIERTPMRVLGTYFPDFHIEDNSSTGFFDAVSNTGFHAYPNPVLDDLTIETEGDINVIHLYNYTGQVVKSVFSVTGKRAIVSMSDLPKGIYILNVQLEDGSFASEKVVKL